VRIDDETTGLKGTPLEGVTLEGETRDAFQQFWDRSAETDAIRAIADQDDEESFASAGRPDAEAVLNLLRPGGVVVEVGCGTGRILQHLAAAAGEVHGVDISPEMIRQGRERLAHLPNIHFHVGNGYDLGVLPDGGADVVFSHFALQHMPKTTVFNYLVESHRVLRPDGWLRIQVPNLLRDDHFDSFRFFTQPHFVRQPYPMNFFTPAEIVRMLLQAGFSVTSMTDYVEVVARKDGRRTVSPDAQRVIAESGALLPDVLSHLAGLEAAVAKRPVDRVAAAVRRIRRT
jgi:SAM-dependent methyltransferase